MSEQKENAVPKAGFMVVAEKRESGFVGTLEAWAFVIYRPWISVMAMVFGLVQQGSSRKS